LKKQLSFDDCLTVSLNIMLLSPHYPGRLQPGVAAVAGVIPALSDGYAGKLGLKSG
jgi:hypothetical protein